MYKKDLTAYPPYYDNYLPLLDENLSLSEALDSRVGSVIEFYNNIPSDKWTYKYEEGKWSIQMLLRHILDAELIFCNRALRIARGEKSPLSGWKQDDYVDSINEEYLNPTHLLEALDIQLKQSKNLFEGFSTVELNKLGNAGKYDLESGSIGYDVTVGAIGFIIYVHELHHRNIIIQKYLN